MAATTLFSQQHTELADKLISTERHALELWNKGNPSGFLELSAPDVVYFDPFTEQRLDGHAKLTELYESIRGQVKVDRYEMINPLVQAGTDMAVLTFNLISYEAAQTSRWNCTEVYRRHPDGLWKIIQTHWSFVRPELR